MNLKEIKKSLIRHEGLRLQPYMDSEGYVTIGIGHKIEPITRQQALNILDDDVRETIRLAYSFDWFEHLDSVRQEVIVNMIFNLGLRGFKTFRHTIKFLKKGDYLSASIEMLDSKWRHQVGSRADELSKIMSTGKRS